MKRLPVLLAAGMITACVCTPAFADLLLYEPFDYTAGQPIAGQVNTYSPGGPTWNAAGAASATVHSVISPGLISPTGFPPSIGNAADMVKADISQFDRLDLPHTYYTNTTLYYSLLLNVPDVSSLKTPNSNANANNDLIIAFNNTTGASGSRPSNWAGELVIRLGSTANNFNLGIRASSTSAGTTYWSSDLNPGQTYLVIGRYVQGADAVGTGDFNDLWINPTALSYGAPEGSVPAPDGTTLGTINQANPGLNYAASLIIGAGISDTSTIGNPANTYLDEIRVGTTWADVTTVPEPSILALAGLGALGLILRCRANCG
jgi:PEP-CTERM motif